MTDRGFRRQNNIIEIIRSNVPMTDPQTSPTISPSVKPVLGAGVLGNVDDDINVVEVVLAAFVVGKIGS
jgi:hypothetical protein